MYFGKRGILLCEVVTAILFSFDTDFIHLYAKIFRRRKEVASFLPFGCAHLRLKRCGVATHASQPQATRQKYRELGSRDLKGEHLFRPSCTKAVDLQSDPPKPRPIWRTHVGDRSGLQGIILGPSSVSTMMALQESYLECLPACQVTRHKSLSLYMNSTCRFRHQR
jgi:hypothetical protein